MKTVLSPDYNKMGMQLFRSLDTPVALSCYLMARHGEWDQLVSKDIDPSTYIDTISGANNYARDRQACAFFKKSKDVPTSFDCKSRAIEQFYECERTCAETNYLLECLNLGLGVNDPLACRVLEIISRAKKIVKRILGPMPPSLDGRFGPGTCFELEGTAYTTLADKLHIVPHVTSAALPVWEHTVTGHHWHRTRLKLGLPQHRLTRGNRFTTVPKDGRTDRGICIEPQGNLYCQLGVGSHLKRRLAGVGLFVNRGENPRDPLQRLTSRPAPNGQMVHRRIAEYASRGGTWATIDLSNASDTVCLQLVKALLPDEWFALLAALRSPYTRMPNGTWVRLEKFSSMGNGYTFELETLIFAAISSAVTGGVVGEDVLVYGDDILVANDQARNVMSALSCLGFTPNMKKSFYTGPFRESCGGDYFEGIGVRPYFSKSAPCDPLEWIVAHNRLVETWPFFRHLHRYTREQVPKRYRVFGPSRSGDAVLHTQKSMHWNRRPQKGDGIQWITGLEAVPVKIPLDRWSSEFHVTLALLGVASTGLIPRNGINRGLRFIPLSIS